MKNDCEKYRLELKQKNLRIQELLAYNSACEDTLMDIEVKFDQEIKRIEKALLEWKELYQSHSDKIIAETDFKALYGKNNDKVRKEHVKKELSTWYDTITDLELGISWINCRISFLRELIRVKRIMMEVKE